MSGPKRTSPDPILVSTAYRRVCNGFSADRVIADPQLNANFIQECQSLGLTHTHTELNLRLLNTRKLGGRLDRSTRRTAVRDQDQYAFASEIAIRCLERKRQSTLDQVLCDPKLAEEFDDIAMSIAPGFTCLEYRWAALRMRKTSRLKPELLGRVVPSAVFGPIAAREIEYSHLPREQGLYMLLSRGRVLYVGEALDLRARLTKHFEHSDNKHLAHYLWEFGTDDVFVEYHLLPPDTRAEVRRAMELELIRSRNSEFNIRR